MSKKNNDNPIELLLSSTTQSKLTLPDESEPDESELHLGSVLHNRYLLRSIGRDSFFDAYIAHDPELPERKFIIKVLREEAMKNEGVKQIIQQGIESQMRLNHPAIARVLETGNLKDNVPYLVMEYVEGVSLRDEIRPGGMDIERVANIIRQLGIAIAAVHEMNIIHRDLKPANIMLHHATAGVEQVKIVDFSIAKINDDVVAPSDNVIVGTVSYMSPEQLRGEPLTKASDIFALGIIAYEMLTGRRPFNPGSVYPMQEKRHEGVKVKPTALRPDIPKLAEEVILRALAVEPSERFIQAQDFGDALALALKPSLAGIAFQPMSDAISETSTEIIFSANELTPQYLTSTLSPVLNAIAEIQDIINEIQGRKSQKVAIKSIRQNSPISISLAGAAEAIQLIKRTVVPWRRKHEEKMSLLLEKEKQVEIGNRKAEISEKRARSTKERAEAVRIIADVAKQREETERLRLENEKLRLELQRAKIQLALDLIAQAAPNLSETDKIEYVVKLLPSLEVIVSSDLEIVIGNQDKD